MTELALHPIVAAAADVRSSLKAVAGVNPTFMSTADKAAALTELGRAESQLAELRLRILADAGDLAHETAAKDAAGWFAKMTRTRFTDARADLALASALDRDRTFVAAAMRDGSVTLAQAHVIHRAVDALPASVDADTVTRAEAHLVAQAAEFGPKELGRIGRRILDVVAPEIAEAVEAARLADLEANAAERLAFSLRRLGDGTTRISGRVPDAVGTRFATYLEAYTNPRRDGARATRRRRATRWSGRRTRSAWARRSPSSSRPSTRPASRSTAATRPRSSSPSRSPRCRPTSRQPTSSAPASSPATTSPATGSPPPRPVGSRAPRRSCPRSSTATPCRSTSVAQSDSSARPSARPS